MKWFVLLALAVQAHATSVNNVGLTQAQLQRATLTLEDDGNPWISTAGNEALVLNLSGSFQVGGFLFYALERA